MVNKKTQVVELTNEALKSCNIFAGLDKNGITEVMKIAHIREYSENEQIFTDGTLGICFYYIIKGSVDITSDDSSDPKILRTYSEGAFFSEVHLFSESVHSVSCISKSLTTLLVISKPDFEELIKLKPKVGSRILLNFLEFFSLQLDKLYRENKQLIDAG